MKKIILTLAVTFSVMFSACRKDLIEYIDSHKKNTVNFRIGGLNHNVGEPNIGFPTEPIKNFISQLTILAYDSQTGTEIMRETQFATNPGFGQIGFNLPKGTYNFVAIGSKTEFGINQFYEGDKDKPVMLPFNEANFQYWQISQSFLDRHYKTDDTFLITKLNNVVNGNQTVDLIMERIVGVLDISVDDVADFEVDLKNDYTAYRFNAKTPFAAMENDFSTGFKKSVNGSIRYYILRTGATGPLSFTIKGGGSGEKSVSPIVFNNKRTVVTGKLLTGEFNITVQ